MHIKYIHTYIINNIHRPTYINTYIHICTYCRPAARH